MTESAPIDLSSVVAQGNDHVAAEVDGEVVMMSVRKGNYYGLDLIGSRIWELIQEPKAVSELCTELTDQFDVDQSQCESDVLKFLNDLAAQDLIRRVDA
jgi:hypothetical protein